MDVGTASEVVNGLRPAERLLRGEDLTVAAEDDRARTPNQALASASADCLNASSNMWSART